MPYLWIVVALLATCCGKKRLGDALRSQHLHQLSEIVKRAVVQSSLDKPRIANRMPSGFRDIPELAAMLVDKLVSCQRHKTY